MAKCGDCKFWSFEPIYDEKDEDDLGECTAMRGVILPHAWRYATREVMSGDRGQEIECKRFDPL